MSLQRVFCRFGIHLHKLLDNFCFFVFQSRAGGGPDEVPSPSGNIFFRHALLSSFLEHIFLGSLRGGAPGVPWGLPDMFCGIGFNTISDYFLWCLGGGEGAIHLHRAVGSR